jgi:hypothetical protein
VLRCEGGHYETKIRGDEEHSTQIWAKKHEYKEERGEQEPRQRQERERERVVDFDFFVGLIPDF